MSRYLGVATEGRLGETLTQATFVEALLKYISNDPRGDRDVLLRGGTIPLPGAEEKIRFPLRNLFISGSDVDIAKIIWNYFEAVRNRWPSAWSEGGRGNILSKTNGFRALMRVFGSLYRRLGNPGQVVVHSMYEQEFGKVDMSDSDFHIDNFPPGTSGEASLVERFRADLGLA